MQGAKKGYGQFIWIYLVLCSRNIQFLRILIAYIKIETMTKPPEQKFSKFIFLGFIQPSLILQYYWLI